MVVRHAAVQRYATAVNLNSIPLQITYAIQPAQQKLMGLQMVNASVV